MWDKESGSYVCIESEMIISTTNERHSSICELVIGGFSNLSVRYYQMYATALISYYRLLVVSERKQIGCTCLEYDSRLQWTTQCYVEISIAHFVPSVAQTRVAERYNTENGIVVANYKTGDKNLFLFGSIISITSSLLKSHKLDKPSINIAP